MKVSKTFITALLLLTLPTLLSAQEKEHVCAQGKIKQQQKYALRKSSSEVRGDSTIDVTYYKLQITIDHSAKNLSGVATVAAKSQASALRSFFLELTSSLTVDSVKSSGQKLAFKRGDAQSQNRLVTTLPAPFNQGELFSVDIYYHGAPGSSGFSSFVFSEHAGEPAIWSLSEPYGASDWFPCKDVPSDKADSSDVWITCDASLKVASNGVLEGIIDNGDGTHTFKWKNDQPIAQYLISVALANYEIYTNEFEYEAGKSMEMMHYNYPENFTAVRKNQLDKTVAMLRVFSEDFGPYPFLEQKYGHAEFGWGGGMEHQTISSMGAYGESIVAHELAHQWFGDKITCKDWHHIWLNEGFATYAEALYKEAAYGIASYHAEMASNMDHAKYAQGSIYVENIDPDLPGVVWEIFDSARSYSKGSVVLHMLRGIVGDALFFQILKTYAADAEMAYGVATTEDFQRIAETVSGKELSYFFHEWIYGENFPRYVYDWSVSALGSDSFKVKIDISQEGNTSPAFFVMPIQLRVKTSRGDTLLTAFNDQQPQSFEFVIGGEPSQLEFDPNNWILKEVSPLVPVEDVPNGVKGFSLGRNYPNPFNPGTKLQYYLPRASEVSLKIYNSLGQEVRVLVAAYQPNGSKIVRWDGRSHSGQPMPSGLYFYRLATGEATLSRKMLLLR